MQKSGWTHNGQVNIVWLSSLCNYTWVYFVTVGDMDAADSVCVCGGGGQNEHSCHFTELLCQSVRLPERTSHQEAKLSVKTQWSTGTQGLYRNAQTKSWQVHPSGNDLTQALRGTKASWNSQVGTSQESHFAFHLEESRGSGFPKSSVGPWIARRKSSSKTPFPNEVRHPPFLP